MELHTNMEVPNYIIYRDIQPGQPFYAEAPLLFFPEKDSDELFDILRAKYPFLKTHSQRVGQAVMDFYMEEHRTDITNGQQMSMPQMDQSSEAITSPCPTILTSGDSSDISPWSSPNALSLTMSSFDSSPRTQPLTRQTSVATSRYAPSESSPPGMEQMTGVFSLSNAQQPKQRTRRKMTEGQKVDYRKTFVALS